MSIDDAIFLISSLPYIEEVRSSSFGNKCKLVFGIFSPRNKTVVPYHKIIWPYGYSEFKYIYLYDVSRDFSAFNEFLRNLEITWNWVKVPVEEVNLHDLRTKAFILLSDGNFVLKFCSDE